MEEYKVVVLIAKKIWIKRFQYTSFLIPTAKQVYHNFTSHKRNDLKRIFISVSHWASNSISTFMTFRKGGKHKGKKLSCIAKRQKVPQNVPCSHLRHHPNFFLQKTITESCFQLQIKLFYEAFERCIFNAKLQIYCVTSEYIMKAIWRMRYDQVMWCCHHMVSLFMCSNSPHRSQNFLHKTANGKERKENLMAWRQSFIQDGELLHMALHVATATILNCSNLKYPPYEDHDVCTVFRVESIPNVLMALPTVQCNPITKNSLHTLWSWR